MPSDSPAQLEEHSLASAIVQITQEIERLESTPLEDALREYLSALSNLQGTKLEAMLARFGWHGGMPVTLQTAADMIGVTRERVRQLEVRTLKRLPSHPVVMPALDKAINLLESSTPIDAVTFSQVVMERGISRGPFHPRSVLEAAKLTGRTVNVKVTKARGRDRFIGAGSTDASARTISLAYRQAGASGVSNILEVSAELQSLGISETSERVRETLRAYSDVQFLDEDWFWHPAGLPDRNRLRNVSRKMLSVASPIELTELREGVRRFFKYRRSRGLSTWPLIVAPRAILEAFYRAHPEFTVDSALGAHVSPLDHRAELSPSEQVMVAVLRSTPTGLVDRASFEKGCLDRGVTRETFSVFTSYSAIIEHLGTDIWTLRGIKANPAGGRSDLRRVGDAVLRTVEGGEAPAAPERVGLPPARRHGAQRPSHQVGKDLPRQADPPIRPGTVGQRLLEQLVKVLGQRAGTVHHMKRERLQQLVDRDARFAPATARQRRHPVRPHHVRPRAEKAREALGRRDLAQLAARRPSGSDRGMCSHPQGKYRFRQKCTRGISHQRISEWHYP